jgi:extracellular factor (EF) 3-hydroxypalmitic acid methyl ester biosynthesis protein
VLKVVSHTANAQSQIFRRIPLHLELGKGLPALSDSLPTAPLHWDVGTVVAKSLLDHVHQRLLDENEDVHGTMADLLSGLWWLKSSSTEAAWRAVAYECLSHPVREAIHQDPFSARSFNKPRGYAGDAVLIDYIYSRNCHLSEHDDVSPLGERIFSFSRDTPTCAAVRSRRDLIASIIDEMCAIVQHPHVLSVACGHLREATLCRSVLRRQTGRFIALDQDQLSLGVVEQELCEYGVVPICNSIKSLFRGQIAREQFDLVYSTGLYDYLDDRIATKLTARLFDMLNPGGRLLVANFLPNIWGAGYMETFMDWKLIYRTPQQMVGLASSITSDDIAVQKTFAEKNANIVFLELVRRS